MGLLILTFLIGFSANASYPHDRTFLYSSSYDNTVGTLNLPEQSGQSQLTCTSLFAVCAYPNPECVVPNSKFYCEKFISQIITK
ncbi:hypothetical protein GLOIN_2v1701875 [Rhizophagus irregularis DAOM 181602=DAOM 197198]|uniref:Uncharacterized protein n=1 Tax=Rhizophagus irregularis (strain DAOM 181602 / DAOM 197198 / MUCL 43194) TaxID=747089 RepID=A0A2P4P8Q0_RHIID|nr:hypothetical protein GLOIN_2v1701875 [Rhizophagus irregularis DAOM 181602=DAOM 197198]POG61754.1 hypothetical protein GLOIN_2v1701875 [Rhizophagus irregularis DAOM 181602=DAOM 197198]|eukprot:XP_025168620.1 hypothetical protein GLOIN_2v1701875 [Rhizophagus irregularis DAOM 181602=DAOM 197198]